MKKGIKKRFKEKQSDFDQSEEAELHIWGNLSRV